MFDSSLAQARPPAFWLEKQFNRMASAMLSAVAALIALMLVPVALDMVMRPINGGFHGVMDVESMGLVCIGFLALSFPTVIRQQIGIDIVAERLSARAQQRLAFFSHAVCVGSCAMLARFIFIAAWKDSTMTPALHLPQNIFIGVTCFGVASMGVAFLYQLLHQARELAARRDYAGLILGVAMAALLFALPFMYKAAGVRLPSLLLGALGFGVLFVLLMLRVPIGVAMMGVAMVGLLATMRTPTAVGAAVGQIPFRQASDFIFLALPMFTLMGELIALAGISDALFDCAQKWLGRLPGGLACAAVAGCAGFGAVCGESLPTVITMSTVAMKPMRQHGIAPGLSCGALAAGGTLGILIPPSMGFIFYSMMTEESVGKLFLAGILPGLLLASLFCATIAIRVLRNPALAPQREACPLGERLRSLLGLIPVAGIFVIVVGGIMTGFVTPGEAGGLGAITALLYALARRRLSAALFRDALRRTALLCAKIFVILVGVFSFGVFLTSSRLPALLAEFVIGLDMSRYLVLFIVIGIYTVMGFVMNVTPMMLLTLPSIYPTIQALNFDGVWFGVLTVIVMEMGLITPPVGMNVFTLASLNPDIPMAEMFRGVMPFFLAMCVCVLLIILFPSIALFLPGLLM